MNGNTIWESYGIDANLSSDDSTLYNEPMDVSVKPTTLTITPTPTLSSTLTLSSTITLSKSPCIKGYKWIADRRFHDVNPKYLFPCDEAEFERLEADHFLTKEILHADFQAPIRNPLEASIRVLDVGCGTGAWTLEMAKEFPESQFYATDISPSFPTNFTQRNVVFKQVNTLDGLPFIDDTFSYVFQRAASFCFTEKDWAQLISEFVRVTKPGGWIELIEPEYVIENPSPKMKEYLNKLKLALRVRGVNTNFPSTGLPDLLQGHGFRNITTYSKSAPVGGSSELGQDCLKSLKLMLTSMNPRMCAVMGIRMEDLDAMVVDFLKEYEDATLKIHVLYGMKPIPVKFPGSHRNYA